MATQGRGTPTRTFDSGKARVVGTGRLKMAARFESVAVYVVVLFLLLLLTVATMGLSFLHLPTTWHVAGGLTIAAVKASLVVLFFMHALVSPRVTWSVIIAAIVWVLILFSLTFADYLTRSMLPYTPGH